MALTSIGDQKTPGRPTEITFAAETGVPSALQEVLLIGRKDAASGTAATGTVVTINAVSDTEAATTEANAKFGEGSELAKMVIAAVKANAAVSRSNFPALKCVALPSTATDFGTGDAALVAAKRVKAEFVVSPFDGMDDTLVGKLKDACAEMSGAQRVHNNQFGTIGVAANMDTVDPADLSSPDTQFLSLVALRDTGEDDDAQAYSLGELAAAHAAVLAGNPAPFVPVNDFVIGGLVAPALQSDWYSIGGGLESETVLGNGWTPLKVKPNGDVAIVRSRTTRITSNGTTAVGAYYDVQDFQVLYLWRKTVYTRLSQPDLLNVKASEETAVQVKSELIRLAQAFQEQSMFQAVDQLAKKFVVQRSTSDRHRFDVFTPVNVIPGLHVVATNVAATTEGDTLSI